MKYRSIPKPSKTTLPEIKQSPTSQTQTKIQPPKLSSSRLSRQSSSIESTQQLSQTEQLKKRELTRPKVNHREMSDYLRRQTIQNSKSFVYNSQDEHIKRILLKHNWIEAPLLSPYFDLKWVYTEDQDEIKVLTEGQYYNHFKNTKELTTKQCLLDNFKNQSQYGFDTSDFFPRAYDLGNLTDREDFIKEYEKNTIFIILKKVIKYLKKVRKDQYREIKKEILNKFKMKSEKKRIQAKKMKWQVQRKYKKIYYIGLIESQTQQIDFRLDLQLMCELLGKLSDYKRQLDDGFYDDKSFELSNKQILNQRFKFFQYSQIDKFVKGQTPNKLLLQKLIGYHQFFQIKDPAYSSDGVQNIWIIKPSGCARGQGIFLEKDIGEAIQSGMKISARLIQKYIERPLLYQNYKFDLRQWVLVKSFQPLQAYAFSHCYMRMCSQKYDLQDTKNLLRHLTNFSLNKTAFENQADSIYSSDHLEEFLAQKNISWQNTIRPQINEIILKTLLIVQDQFDGENKNCFELFGFDIMLDYQYKPWLLEVNLSPACTERASWLSEMLNQMTESMLNIIMGDDFKQPEKYKYELLINEDVPPQVKDNNLQVDGYKCNLRTEYKMDKAFYRKFATITIQKFFRMFLAKNQLTFLKRTKYSMVIQKYWKGKLARNRLLRLKKNRDAIIIQKIVRGFIAKRRKYHRKRQVMATKIQCAARIRQAKQLKINLKKEYSALICQSLMRMVQAKKQALKQKEYYGKIVRIQRVWRYRYFKVNNKAILIQKHIKRMQQRRRYLKLLLQIRCSIKIQSIWRMYKSVQIKKFLKTEFSALILQCLIKRKKRQIDLKLMKINDGLMKIDKVYCSYKPKLFIRKAINYGILRVKATQRIQGYRLVIKSKRFLKRLKRLKRLIKLQATVRMHIQRQKYKKIIRRIKAAKLLIKSIRRYIFRKKIQKRILQKRMIANYKLQQQLQQAPVRPKPRMIAKKK